MISGLHEIRARDGSRRHSVVLKRLRPGASCRDQDVRLSEVIHVRRIHEPVDDRRDPHGVDVASIVQYTGVLDGPESSRTVIEMIGYGCLLEW